MGFCYVKTNFFMEDNLKTLNKKEIESLYNEIRTTYFDNSNFKAFCKEQCYYYGILTLDSFFVNTFKNAPSSLDIEYDGIRHSCREFLKLNSEKDSGKIDFKYNEIEYNNTLAELENLSNYNFIRNRLENAFVKGGIKVCYDDSLKLIDAEEESEKALLGRKMDKIKPAHDINSALKNSSEVKMISIAQNRFAKCPIINRKNFMSKKEYILSLYDFMMREYDDDSSVTNDFEFDDFSFDEYKKVYCALKVLAYNKMEKSFHENVIPSVIWKKDELIDFVWKLSGLDIDKVVFILENFLVYDKDFHKDMIAIYQPVFDLGDYYLISSSLTLFGFAQDKMVYMMNAKVTRDFENNKYQRFKTKTNEATLSKIANFKEKLMVEHYSEFLKDKNFSLEKNVKFSREKIKDVEVEIDLALLDRKQKILFLIELKDFLKGDNEIEQLRINAKINEFVENRKLAQKFVEDNLHEFVKKTFKENAEVDEVFSMLVSKNFAGFEINTAIPVVEEYMYFNIFEKNNFDLLKIKKQLQENYFGFDVSLNEDEKIEHIFEFNGYKLKMKTLRFRRK